jgi:alkylation response protein AidB-like acyl-CoA dehydrogenase
MGTVSRLPEKVRMTAPIIESESEAFDGVHTLIRRLSPANDGFAPASNGIPSLFPAIADSGLLGITVPSEFGGADISNTVLAEIVLSTASANRMAAAWLASHFHSIELLRGSPATGPSSYFYGRILAGDLFLAAGPAELGQFHAVTLSPEAGRPGFRLTGSMESPIDPIHADWIVICLSDHAGEHAIFIPRMTTGLRLTPEKISFKNVHVDADCFVTLAPRTLSTAVPISDLLQAAQKLGWAERELADTVALHARPSLRRRPVGPEYLSALGLTVSRIESAKAALERAGRKIDTAQVNGDEEAVQKAAFASEIAVSSAAEAFDLAAEIDTDRQPSAWNRMDPYGHAPIGARLLENSIH